MEKQKSPAQAYFEYQKKIEERLNQEMLIDDRLQLLMPVYLAPSSKLFISFKEEMKQVLKQELKQEIKQELRQEMRKEIRECFHTEPLNINFKIK